MTCIEEGLRNLAVHTDLRPTQITSREAYFLLEQKLQDLRFRIMHLATDLAESQGATVKICHVDKALTKIVEMGLEFPVSADHPLRSFPDDAYQCLARRILTLYRVMTAWAAKFAHTSRLSNDDAVIITPEHIERAWQQIGTPTQLREVLLPSDFKES